MLALGVAPHEQLLIAYDLSDDNHDAILIRPVTDVARDENGFCDVSLGEVELECGSLRLDAIGAWGARRHSVMRGGYKAGALRRRTDSSVWIVQSYELTADYDAGGLNIAISGQLVAAGAESGKPFSVDATVPWSTLKVKGIQSSAAHSRFGHSSGLPSKLDSLDRPRDPRKLNDLLIAVDVPWSYMKGRISFTPEPSWPSWRSTHNFVSIDFDSDHVRFKDARGLEVLDTGFARHSGSSREVTVSILNQKRLEKALQQRDAFSIQLAGNAIGSVRYETGYGQRTFDPFGWIQQSIKTITLSVALGKDGLAISAEGELDEFDPVELAQHREERNSQLKPLHAYALQATMPWALLAARGIRLPKRVWNSSLA
jgi:hypothetical protein